jgi:subtilisin family serine protease/photosystem II stability/assembly factor-like uncharacterized protein
LYVAFFNFTGNFLKKNIHTLYFTATHQIAESTRMNHFSSFKKLAICVGLAGLSALELASAAVSPQPPQKKNALQPGNLNGGYTIVRPGMKRADGFTTAARVIAMPRLSPDEYMPGMIHIKTKKRFVLNKNAQGFQSGVLTKALSSLDVKKVDAAFEEYNNGSLLSTDEFGLSRMYELYYSAPVDVYDVCRELMENPEVEYASPVFKKKLLYVPNDPKISSQYEISRIKASQAWDVTKGKAEVLIAITDSGTDWQHEDLADNIWTNPNEIPNNQIDDDNNGKIDDIRGWDFVGNASLTDANQGNFKEDNDPKVSGIISLSDGRAHGTVVAGNAAAVTNNGKGVASIGHNSKLLPIKIGSDNPQNTGLFQTGKAIEYAARMGADIINCSWGGGGYDPFDEDIIAQATAGGSLVIAAAGNDGTFTDLIGSYPALYANVLSVGATDNADKPADFSNYGIKTTVYAPGVAMQSVYPGNKYVQSQDWSGTSFSSPIVSGIAALIKSVHPDWTPAQIAAQIRMTSDNVITSDAALRPLYYGRVNAYRAVFLNSTLNQGEQASGVDVVSIGLNTNGGMITNNQPVPLRISLKNQLSNATGVQVQIQSMDGALSISQNNVNVGDIASMEQKDIDATVQLSPNSPFFEGMGEFLVTIKSGTFTNYHRVSIPFRVPSTNTYTLLNSSMNGMEFHSASAPNASTFWAAAEAQQVGTVVFKITNGAPNYSIPTQDAVYTIFARDANNAWAGTGPMSGLAQILRTTNGATTGWQSSSVSSITPFVNNINFFDASNGIFLGDPLNSAWGVGKTSNGGQNWTKVNNLPNPLSGETGLNTSAYWVGNNGWFGTTKGRVFRTTDKGQTWKVSTLLNNGIISLLAFKDAMNGIAVYRTTSATDAPSLAAVTSDGGATWTLNKFNFTANNLYPVYGYNPGDSRQTAFLCSNSEVVGTEDNGETWSFILTKQSGEAQAGAAVISGSSVRMWNVGTAIGYLDYAKLSGSVKKELTVASSFSFDTVSLGDNKTRLAQLRNTGEVDITVSAISISGGNAESEEFKLLNLPSLPKVIAPGSVVSFQIIFNAKQEGARTATLAITSNADPALHNASLLGIGKKTGTSVQELEAAGIRLQQTFPNPTAGQTSLNFEVPSAQNVRLTVANALGQTLAIPFEGVAAPGVTAVPFNASALSNGVYYYTLEIAGQRIVRSFVVQK